MTQLMASRISFVLDWLADIWVPVFLFLLVACSLNHDPRAVSDLSYGVILVFVLGGLPLGLRRSGRIDLSRFSIIPLVLTALWAYGVILGIYHGLSPNIVFRNFAAMSLFFIYYVILLLSPSIKKIQAAIYWSSALFVLSVIYLIITSQTRTAIEDSGFMALRYHYYLGSIISSAAMFALTVRSFVTGPFRLWEVVFGAAIFSAILFSGSRAFYLALFASMAIIGLSFLPSQPFRFLRAAALGAGYAAFAAILVMVWAGPESAILAPAQSIRMEFSPEAPRVDQFGALMAEITFFGKGLGAPLESGFSRDALGYGFELSYLSLAHKVGFLGLLVFLACAGVHLARSVRTMILSNHSVSMVSAVALMGFLFSSWGNPTLFAPLFVCFFCVSLYIERTVANSLNVN